MARIYYSHAICTYNTFAEMHELAIIEKMFPTHEIVDPGTYEDNPEKGTRGMDYCLELVESCDALVYSRILGKVTAGVGKEIEHALSLGRTVYELVGDRVNVIRKSPESVSRDRTKRLYIEWKVQNLKA